MARPNKTRTDPKVRAVVIYGGERVFAAGAGQPGQQTIIERAEGRNRTILPPRARWASPR
jgi:enoyl-CoA hydratase/carnithine racemase